MLDAGISDAGVASVDVKITDTVGRALDRTGTFTEGVVAVSFVLGYLEERSDGLPLQYVSYTKRNVTSAVDGGVFVQNATDTGGTWAELDPVGSGLYRYRFATAAAVGANANRTHSVGLYATRTFQTQRYVDNGVFHFRPDGAPVTTKRDIVTTAACDGCHTRLEAHGGARRDVNLCIMCHTRTNDLDPESGNTIDFKVMIHNIHRGANLPSVDAGVPYQFVGFQNAVSDFSDVVYPGAITNCDACHTGSQGARWKTNPSQENCSGCHNRTWFATETPPAGFTLHSGGARADSQCIVCHDVASIQPIELRHPLPARDPNRIAVASTILAVPPTAPGQLPKVTFSVTVNGAPRDVLTQRLSRLRFTIGGPNTDYARFFSETAETAPECANATSLGCFERVDAGVFTYHAKATMLPSDQGSFTVGMELCQNNDAGVRWCALNPVAPFAVTDATAVPRAKNVTLAKCNQCHQTLGAHGGTRNNPEYCVVCHSANTVANVVVPANGTPVTAESVNFRRFIHELHAAAAYPSPLNNCAQCHTPTGYALPLPDGTLPSRSETRSCGPNGFPTDGGTTCVATAVVATPIFEAPTSGTCTSCHDSLPAQVHAGLNTNASLQEACSVCHAAGRSEGVDSVHALTP